MAPFDAALRALAADGPSADPAELLAWSLRRKAAALRLVRTGVSGKELPVSPPGPRLDRYEVLLDYSVLPDAVLLLVGRRPEPGEQENVDLDLDALWLETSPDSLRSLVEELRRPFDAVYGGRLDLARAPYSQPAARALYEAILAPAEEFVGDARRLLVSPDGALHRVSFAGLVAPAMAGRAAGDYLVDRYEIVYLTAGGFGSGSHAAGDEAVAMDGQLSVLFGDAPGTRAELETLARLWPGQVLGGETRASAESSVHEMSSPPAVLHVAAHAIADDRDPFASHILLLADSLEDGLLHGMEIERLDLTGSLVVLSACETVEGPLFEGEGLLGLRRSFQAAGASQVLATLWPVGPSAADLSRYFYDGIVMGLVPSEALREAQLRMRSDPATAHPFHWAGFVLFGGG
jgi:CHAT domain-containing protein